MPGVPAPPAPPPPPPPPPDATLEVVGLVLFRVQRRHLAGLEALQADTTLERLQLGAASAAAGGSGGASAVLSYVLVVHLLVRRLEATLAALEDLVRELLCTAGPGGHHDCLLHGTVLLLLLLQCRMLLQGVLLQQGDRAEHRLAHLTPEGGRCGGDRACRARCPSIAGGGGGGSVRLRRYSSSSGGPWRTVFVLGGLSLEASAGRIGACCRDGCRATLRVYGDRRCAAVVRRHDDVFLLGLLRDRSAAASLLKQAGQLRLDIGARVQFRAGSTGRIQRGRIRSLDAVGDATGGRTATAGRADVRELLHLRRWRPTTDLLLLLLFRSVLRDLLVLVVVIDTLVGCASSGFFCTTRCWPCVMPVTLTVPLCSRLLIFFTAFSCMVDCCCCCCADEVVKI
uniref:Uncharacterized protein n=1 Tax=Anopheles atroparvus TaxID=41427 RepID=A0A182J6L9_ANOAO